MSRRAGERQKSGPVLEGRGGFGWAWIYDTSLRFMVFWLARLTVRRQARACCGKPFPAPDNFKFVWGNTRCVRGQILCVHRHRRNRLGAPRFWHTCGPRDAYSHARKEPGRRHVAYCGHVHRVWRLVFHVRNYRGVQVEAGSPQYMAVA